MSSACARGGAGAILLAEKSRSKAWILIEMQRDMDTIAGGPPADHTARWGQYRIEDRDAKRGQKRNA